jgi:hypothetical protein
MWAAYRELTTMFLRRDTSDCLTGASRGQPDSYGKGGGGEMKRREPGTRTWSLLPEESTLERIRTRRGVVVLGAQY